MRSKIRSFSCCDQAVNGYTADRAYPVDDVPELQPGMSVYIGGTSSIEYLEQIPLGLNRGDFQRFVSEQVYAPAEAGGDVARVGAHGDKL